MATVHTLSFKHGHTLMFGDVDVITFEESKFSHHVLAIFHESSKYGIPRISNVNGDTYDKVNNPYHLKIGEALNFGGGLSVMISRMSKMDFRVCVKTDDYLEVSQKKENYIVTSIKDEKNGNRQELRTTRRPDK